METNCNIEKISDSDDECLYKVPGKKHKERQKLLKKLYNFEFDTITDNLFMKRIWTLNYSDDGRRYLTAIEDDNRLKGIPDGVIDLYFQKFDSFILYEVSQLDLDTDPSVVNENARHYMYDFIRSRNEEQYFMFFGIKNWIVEKHRYKCLRDSMYAMLASNITLKRLILRYSPNNVRKWYLEDVMNSGILDYIPGRVLEDFICWIVILTTLRMNEFKFYRFYTDVPDYYPKVTGMTYHEGVGYSFDEDNEQQ